MLFHIKKDGTVGPCKAKVGGCPLGSKDDHIVADNELEANIINADKLLNLLNGALDSVSKGIRYWDTPGFNELSLREQYVISKENFVDEGDFVNSDTVRLRDISDAEGYQKNLKRDYQNYLSNVKSPEDISRILKSDLDAFEKSSLLDNPYITSEVYESLASSVEARQLSGEDLAKIYNSNVCLKKKNDFDSQLTSHEKIELASAKDIDALTAVILLRAPDKNVSDSALHNFRENKEVASFVLSSNDPDLVERFIKVARRDIFDDDDIMNKIFMPDTNIDVKKKALEKTSNKYWLAKALEDSKDVALVAARNPNVSSDFVSRYSQSFEPDQDVLRALSLNSRMDEGPLSYIYLKANNEVRMNIIHHKNITSKTLLRFFSNKSSSMKIKLEIRKKLKELDS